MTHRTITWPFATARKVKLASAYLGVSGEAFIASAIDQALADLARRDPAVGRILSEVK